MMALITLLKMLFIFALLPKIWKAGEQETKGNQALELLSLLQALLLFL